MGFIEKFSYLIAEDGKFKKYLKVLLNEEQNKIWIDIRLFFEDHPTKHGVTINQLEYFNLADMLKGIHLKQTINENEAMIQHANCAYLKSMTLSGSLI